MACEKCEREGKTKTIHYQSGGRWVTRVYCPHSYAGGRLNKTETGHVIARQDAPSKKSPQRVMHSWREHEDRFILQNYVTARTIRNHRGEKLMDKMLDAFGVTFGWRPTRNQVVGRYHHLHEIESELIGKVRGVPSLPVLKFMQCDGRGSE
jgi:hypothetical protein